MARKHSPDQLQQMRRVFLQLYQCGDGQIGHSQLGECLRMLGANPSEASIRQHIRQLRARCIERVSFDEVLQILESITSRAEARQSEAGMATVSDQFISCLRFFDEHNTGYIPAVRLRRILTTCGERLTSLEMDELLVNRVNDQGLVDYVEFVHAILTPNKTYRIHSSTQMQ